MADITELVIVRAQWLRGSNSTLLNENGMMCCLGFLGRVYGINEGDLQDLSSPEDTGCEWGNGTFRDTTPLADAPWITAAIVINDDNSYETDALREAALIRLFAKQGITLSFV